MKIKTLKQLEEITAKQKIAVVLFAYEERFSCRMMINALDELGVSYHLADMNVNELHEYARDLNIYAFPVVWIFINGKPSSFTGYRSLRELQVLLGQDSLKDNEL